MKYVKKTLQLVSKILLLLGFTIYMISPVYAADPTQYKQQAFHPYVGHDLGAYPLYFTYQNGIHLYPNFVSAADGPATVSSGSDIARSTWFNYGDPLNNPIGYASFDENKKFNNIDKNVNSSSWKALTSDEQKEIDLLGALIAVIMAGPDGDHSLKVFNGKTTEDAAHVAVAALVMGYASGYFVVDPTTGYTKCNSETISVGFGNVNFMTNNKKVNQYMLQLLSYVDMYMHWVKTGKPEEVLRDTRVGGTAKEVIAARYPSENLTIPVPQEYPGGEINRNQVKTFVDVGYESGSPVSPDMYITSSIKWLQYNPEVTPQSACYGCRTSSGTTYVIADTPTLAQQSANSNSCTVVEDTHCNNTVEQCYSCTTTSGTKYIFATTQTIAEQTTSGTNCTVVEDNKCNTLVEKCYSCTTTSGTKYTYATIESEARSRLNSTSCTVVENNRCNVVEENCYYCQVSNGTKYIISSSLNSAKETLNSSNCVVVEKNKCDITKEEVKDNPKTGITGIIIVEILTGLSLVLILIIRYYKNNKKA